MLNFTVVANSNFSPQVRCSWQSFMSAWAYSWSIQIFAVTPKLLFSGETIMTILYVLDPQAIYIFTVGRRVLWLTLYVPVITVILQIEKWELGHKDFTPCSSLKTIRRSTVCVCQQFRFWQRLLTLWSKCFLHDTVSVLPPITKELIQRGYFY